MKNAAKPLLTEHEQKQLADALGDGGLLLLKRYRDAAIYARHLNFSTGVGVRVDRKAHVSDVLITQEALDAGFSILEILKEELFAAHLFISGMKSASQCEFGDPKKLRLEEFAANLRSQFQAHQLRRLSLPPFPKFPSEFELLAARI